MSELLKACCCGLIVLLPQVGLANPGGGGEDGRRGPPPQAVEVCADLQEGDACTFTAQRGEEQGTCKAGPRPELPLACRPEGRRPPPAER